MMLLMFMGLCAIQSQLGGIGFDPYHVTIRSEKIEGSQENWATSSSGMKNTML